MSDLISKGKLIEDMDSFITRYKDSEKIIWKTAHRTLVFAKEIIGLQPTVEAVPVVHGEWIIKTDEYEFAKWDECSICGHKLKAIGCGKDFNFCPNCGADMRKKV